MAQALFISRKDLVRHTTVNGNLDVDLYVQYIFIAQDIHLQNYLGTDLYTHIEGLIEAGTLGNFAHYETLEEKYCKPALIHWAMVEFLPFGAYSIANKGVYKHTSENAQNVDKQEIDFLIEKERNTAQYYTNRLIDYLTYNAPSKFPQYYTSTNADITPDGTADFGGWVL